MSSYLSDDDYEYIFGKVPRLCIDLFIKTEEGVLLGFRTKSPYKDLWNTIGGMVYKGETIVGACKRVAKNEAGIEVRVVKFLGYVEYPNEEKGIHSVSLVVEASIIGGKLKPDDHTGELRFFKELPENLIKQQREFLSNII